MSRRSGDLHRSCDACGRELEADQRRFCTDMCRRTFQEVFSTAPAETDDEMDDEAAAFDAAGFQVRSVGSEARRDEDVETDDDFDDFDDFDDDDFDDDLGLEDLDDDDLDDDLDEADDDLPAAVASRGVLSWEREPEMERHAGIRIKRATCRLETNPSGGLRVSVIAELMRMSGAPIAGRDMSLHLTAIAEDAAGEFLGWQKVSIPKWDEIPPLHIVGNFSMNVASRPSRFRIYPVVG